MKKIGIFIICAAFCSFTGCVSDVAIQNTVVEEDGDVQWQTEDSIASRKPSYNITVEQSVLYGKLVSRNEKIQFLLRKNSASLKQYSEDLKTVGETQAILNVLEKYAIMKMSSRFDKACIERGLELIRPTEPPHKFVEVLPKDSLFARKNMNSPKSKLILLYTERRSLYNDYSALLREIIGSDDYNAMREIPFFATLELELLGLEDKYKTLSGNQNQND